MGGEECDDGARRVILDDVYPGRAWRPPHARHDVATVATVATAASAANNCLMKGRHKECIKRCPHGKVKNNCAECNPCSHGR